MPAYTCLYSHGFITSTYTDIAIVTNTCGYYRSDHTNNGAHSIYDT
jgi:hypothetical protein